MTEITKKELKEIIAIEEDEAERLETMAEEQDGAERRQSIPINLISQTEMKAHTNEMRSEMDRKFVKTLMATGFSKLEARTRVKTWNAEQGVR